MLELFFLLYIFINFYPLSSNNRAAVMDTDTYLSIFFKPLNSSKKLQQFWKLEKGCYFTYTNTVLPISLIFWFIFVLKYRYFASILCCILYFPCTVWCTIPPKLSLTKQKSAKRFRKIGATDFSQFDAPNAKKSSAK